MTTVKIHGLKELQSSLNRMIQESTSEWLKVRMSEYPAPVEIEMELVDGVYIMREESKDDSDNFMIEEVCNE